MKLIRIIGSTVLAGTLGGFVALTFAGCDEEPVTCDHVTADWDAECFADELAGSVVGRGWDGNYSEFDPSIPDIAAVFAPDGMLESVEGISCQLRCESMGFGGPILEGDFGEIRGTILGTCRTDYVCSGYAFQLSIQGADVSPEWQGALWALHANGTATGFEGSQFNASWEWNLGHANVPYEGCVPSCVDDGHSCGHDGCGGTCGHCNGGECNQETNTCGDPPPSCTSDGDCESGHRCEVAFGWCVPTAGCVSSGSCETSPCCSGTTCVAIGETAECLENCSTPSACSSNCCWPLSDTGSVCVTSDYCASCAAPNAECAPIDNPCCPGAACIWIDGVGARCQAQSDECPAGCENPYGSSCCRPPFCAGDCVGSPCCS